MRPWECRFEAASEERMAFPIPEKSSIALLPFDNLSGDPEKEHFADGLTENIISTLSRVLSMFVIALAYAALGREDEAREQIALLCAEDLQFMISQIHISAPHKDTSLVERRAAVLKRLGLPE